MALTRRFEGAWGVVIIAPLGELDALRERVSSFEWRESEQRFTSERRRREWLTSRAVVRGELASIGGARGCGEKARDCGMPNEDAVSSQSSIIEYNKLGAPYINPIFNTALHISISHTEDCVAVMLSHGGCAVDIEHSERRVEHLLSRFASEHEQRLVASGELSPIALWCAKEVLYKFAGREGVSFVDDIRVDSVSLAGGERTLSCSICSAANPIHVNIKAVVSDDYTLLFTC